MNDTAPHHPAQQWRQIVHAMILGGDRNAPPPVSEQRIDALVRQAKPEEAWLCMTASMSLYGRVGHECAEAPQTTPPFDASGDVVCSPAAGAALRSILHGGYRSLLECWCRAAACAGRVVPAEHVPAILDAMHSRDTQHINDVLQAVAGERGRWLARRAPQWQSRSANVTEEQDAWDTGTAEQRLSFLRRLRTNDPAQALKLLASTWDKESHEDRAALIGALETGLNPDDEPFLESALDDKRKPVRQEAARLLALLPGSALRRRIAARAVQMVGMTGGWRGRKLKVTLPEKADEQLRRDGIESRKRGRMGERAVLLSGVVAVSPLETWADAEPEQWVHAAQKTDWAEALLRGWYAATARRQHAGWARALTEYHLAAQPPKEQPHWEQELKSTLPLVESTARSALVCGQLKKHGIHGARAWLDAIDHWPVGLSKLVLDEAKKHFCRQGRNYDWTLRDWLKERAALCLDVSLADEADRGWPSDADHWNDKLAEMVDRIVNGLKLRQIIHREFSS